jgi:hypothetical protein
MVELGDAHMGLGITFAGYCGDDLRYHPPHFKQIAYG